MAGRRLDGTDLARIAAFGLPPEAKRLLIARLEPLEAQTDGALTLTVPAEKLAHAVRAAHALLPSADAR